MNVLIPIETSSRELVYKTYLSIMLADKGFSCYLGSKPNINYICKYLKNYIYLDKGYHEGVSELIYSDIQKNNGIIVNLDEEGAVDYADNNTLKHRYTPKLFKTADAVFLWGTYQQELIKRLLNEDKKLIVTGHPRFELLKPKYHSLYKNETEKIIKKHSDFILINTNMSFGNNIKGDSFIYENYKSRFKHIEKIIAFDKIKMDSYINLMKYLSQHTDKKIILRPHPEESIEFYKNKLKDIENIEVIYSGSVVPWLLAAKEIIHPDCTTAIEACFLNKIPISYMPKNYPKDIVTKIPIDVSLKFQDISSTVDYLLSKKNGFKQLDEQLKILEEYFSFSKESSKLIITKLDEIKQEKHKKSHQKKITRHIIYLKIKDFINSLRKNNDSLFIKNKLKGFNFKNIIEIQSSISQVDVSKQVVIKKCNKNLFLFKKQ